MLKILMLKVVIVEDLQSSSRVILSLLRRDSCAPNRSAVVVVERYQDENIKTMENNKMPVEQA